MRWAKLGPSKVGGASPGDGHAFGPGRWVELHPGGWGLSQLPVLVC